LNSVENEEIEPAIETDMKKAIDEFTTVLGESVRKRVADIPYLE
jgi:hypothetical protein